MNLMWLVLISFVSSAVAFLIPVNGRLLKKISVILSLIPLAMLIYGNIHWIGVEIEYPWLPNLGVNFHLRIDALSLVFVFLAAIIVPTSLLAVRSNNFPNPNMFFGLALLLEGLLMGFFAARDLVLFTFFWEAMLLPLYFMISLWGGPKRQAAAIKFLIYLIAGSFLMVAAVLALYLTSLGQGEGTFNMNVLTNVAESTPYAAWICAAFFLAFAVKTPLFPFHAWLPDAYYQASTPGTILLSAILSKAGIYGFLRIGIEFFPTYIQAWSPLLLGLAIAGVFYGALAAWMQNDFKRLLAYSSFSHVNFVLVGVFVWSETAHSGAILQAFNHGVTIAALFLVAGWLQERVGTTTIGPYHGLAKYFPQLCWLTLFFVLSSVALPGLNNFVGEIMILFGLYVQLPWTTAFLSLSVVLSVVYMLRWMQKVYFETPSDKQEGWNDIKGRELAIALPLILLILWIGIYPAPVLKQIIKPNSEVVKESS